MQQVLTAAVGDALVQAVSQGVPLATAVRAAGLSQQAFYRLMERAKTGQEISQATRDMAIELLAKLDAARAEWESHLVAGIQATALDVDSRDSFRAKTWLLNNHPSTRQTYREERRSVVEHQPTDSNVVHVVNMVRELPNEQLLALGAALESDAETNE